jgi:hypothetical protein
VTHHDDAVLRPQLGQVAAVQSGDGDVEKTHGTGPIKTARRQSGTPPSFRYPLISCIPTAMASDMSMMVPTNMPSQFLFSLF